MRRGGFLRPLFPKSQNENGEKHAESALERKLCHRPGRVRKHAHPRLPGDRNSARRPIRQTHGQAGSQLAQRATNG